MCGIVGYVGPKDSIPILVGGLERLEYRGYDSAGVATVCKERFQVFRAEGKLSNLKGVLSEKRNSSDAAALNVGIGHTRWATHGRPSEINAHPHVAGDVCVVHNGIIENYVDLRQKLQAKGCQFKSETDTEIAAHLINSHLEKSSSLLSAVRNAVGELEGSYALVVMSLKEPDKIVIARNATPIVLGIGEGETYLASDIPALLEHTREMIFVEDNEIAEIRADGIYIECDGNEVKREPTTITWDPLTAEKGGFRHFMLKEIYEQAQAITDTFRGRIDQQDGEIFLDGVNLSDEDFKRFNRVCIVACGTAWHAALVAKFYIESLAKIPVEIDYGSEFRYREPLVNEDTLFLVVSQSGETADTLGSLEAANKCHASTVAICNVVGSSIARKAKGVLYTHAGPEISVASTKAFVTQLTAAYLLAVRMGMARGHLTKDQAAERMHDLVHLPSVVNAAVERDRAIEKIARKYGRSYNFLYIGRGMLYPIALEGALKLKEISYLHAEGYPAGEMKHGPIALIDEETPVVVVLGHDGANFEKAMSNVREVESRGGRVIAICDRATDELRELAWEVVEVGEVAPMMLPIALVIPLQLLAYHVAVYRGTDVDQPRNLAKSVTVE